MKPSFRLLRSFALMLVSLLLTIFILLSIIYLFLDSQLPDVHALKDVQLPIPLRVYTSDGQLLAEFGELRRQPVTLNDVPPLLVKAILAIEDQRYYQHPGVDLLGLLRASGELLLTGTKAQGGSTITMQVARNFYLSREKTFLRKFTEIMLALKIERELSKDEILELYLNKIYLGNRAYGVAAAAHVYYGKSLEQLTLPEVAMIAGLPKAPSTINPLANPIAAKQRRDHVLERMYELDYITKSAYQAAIATPLNASFHGETIPVRAPYVAEMVRDMMVTSFGEDAYKKGYNVYTTIDSKQQLAANLALRNALLAYDHRHGYRGPQQNLGTPNLHKPEKWLAALQAIPSVNSLKPAVVTSLSTTSVTALLPEGDVITIPWSGLAWTRLKTINNILKSGDVIRVQKTANSTWELAQIPTVEGALVALNPQNGAINALVGGFDYNHSKFNRVIQANRQAGSGFKPYIYAAALAKDYTLASIVNDAPLVFNIPGRDTPWRPQNDDRTFRGPVRLRYALAHSINLVSVRLLQAIGVPYAVKYITRFGFNADQLPQNLTLALGTASITPLQQARGYAVFANGGYRITPYFIDHVTDNQGTTAYQSQPKIACTSCITSDAPPPASDTTQYAPQAIPPQIAFLMTSALQDVVHHGTGIGASALNRNDIAGKTGTTNDQVDTWFSGFNSDIVTVAWVGFDQPASIHEYGSQAALPMWLDFMKVALADKPEHTMPQPSDIVTANIDPATGMLASGGIPEYFRKDALPQAGDGNPEVIDGGLGVSPEDNSAGPEVINGAPDANPSKSSSSEPLF